MEVLTSCVIIHAHPPKSQVVRGQALVDVAAAINVLTSLDPAAKAKRRLDLTGVDLHGLELLPRAYLNGVDMSAANVTSTNLVGADWSDATLNDAKLLFAHLKQAIMIRAQLAGADLGTSPSAAWRTFRPQPLRDRPRLMGCVGGVEARPGLVRVGGSVRVDERLAAEPVMDFAPPPVSSQVSGCVRGRDPGR
ncbi:pentapeptide repeat-containing protein [Nonomuraea dietziae]